MSETPLSIPALRKEVEFLERLAEKGATFGVGRVFGLHDKDVEGTPYAGAILDRLIEQGVITDVERVSSLTHTSLEYRLAITPQFAAYLKSQRELLNQQNKSTSPSTHVAWVEYDDMKREVILNGFLLLSTPHYGKTNERLLQYLVKRPNQQVEMKALEQELKVVPLDVWQAVSDLGFKGELGKLFFSVSSHAVTFHNPITRERLTGLYPQGRIRLPKSSPKSPETI